MDFENVKDRVCFKLINKDRNAELLSDMPYIEFLDLAVIFYVLVSEDEMGTGPITIHNSLMKHGEQIRNCKCQYKIVVYLSYKNVEKPTFLYDIFI